jgi:hypothetical protein
VVDLDAGGGFLRRHGSTRPSDPPSVTTCAQECAARPHHRRRAWITLRALKQADSMQCYYDASRKSSLPRSVIRRPAQGPIRQGGLLSSPDLPKPGLPRRPLLDQAAGLVFMRECTPTGIAQWGSLR